MFWKILGAIVVIWLALSVITAIVKGVVWLALIAGLVFVVGAAYGRIKSGNGQRTLR